MHENTAATLKEVDDIKKQESNLVPFKIILGEKDIRVFYQLTLTMIDSKVCNAITNNASTQCCYLYQVTLKNFNKIDELLQKEVSTNGLQLGLLTLHAWIRFFECCLHVVYKLDIKKVVSAY